MKLTLNTTSDSITINKTVSMLLQTYIITASSLAGGSISPNGVVTVNSGENQTFTIRPNSGYSIDSVTVDGVNQGAISTYTFTNILSEHTISARFKQNSGGNTGGSVTEVKPTPTPAPTPIATARPAITTPEPVETTIPTVNETVLESTVDASGNIIAALTDDVVNKAIENAIATSDENGGSTKDIAIVFRVDSANPKATTVNVNLPISTQKIIINNEVNKTVFIVNNQDITISMGLEAVSEINKQANSDVMVRASRIDNNSLDETVKSVVGDRPTFDLAVSYEDGDKFISDFGHGQVTVSIPYELKEDESVGGLHIVYVDEDNKTNYIKNSSYDRNDKVIRFTTNHFSIYGISHTVPTSFKDISNHWAKDYIEFALSRNLMDGVSQTSFSPNKAITRGEFAEVLGRLANIDVELYKDTTFSDIKANDEIAPYINWANSKGIITSSNDNEFNPNQVVTRQEVAVIIMKYAELTNQKIYSTREAITFKDQNSIDSWAIDAVNKINTSGIINNKDRNNFDPTASATRGEISALLHHYIELVIEPALSLGLSKNDSGSTILYEDGKLVKNQSRTINGKSYKFNSYGEAIVRTKYRHLLLHTIKRCMYIYDSTNNEDIIREEVLKLNNIMADTPLGILQALSNE